MMTLKQLPETGLLRLPTVLSFIEVSKSTWWAGVKSGRFPQRVKLGERITVWRAEDIRNYIERQKILEVNSLNFNGNK